MLYCIYHGFPLGGRAYSIGKDKTFVLQMVNAYLRGDGEICISGRNYSVGSESFQIFEVPESFGNCADIENMLYQVHSGNLSERLFNDLFKNVTDSFLRGSGWGDLKEAYFNIYINDGANKPIIIVLTELEVKNFLSDFSKGVTPIWVNGRSIKLIKPKSVKIFDISLEHRSKERSEINKRIKQYVNDNNAGLWNTHMLESFGSDVTAKFNIKPFSSEGKIISDQETIGKEHSIQHKINGKIFISHSSKDERFVKKFVDLILDNALGVDSSKIFCTSIEGLGIKSGEDFKKRIKSELIESSIVIQIISKNYKESEICLNEMGAAWVLSNEVVPLLLDDDYDIGFIHGNTQQLKLNSKKDILQLIEDKVELFPNKSPLPKINRHIDDFILAIK